MLGLNPKQCRLSDLKDDAAVVLLGEPGMGKTTEFELQSNGRSHSARDFITLNVDLERDEPVFIDGLDELRAGTSDVRAPFDEIRAKLQQLGTPKFRISCREADWLATDQGALQQVSATGSVTVARLDPLTDAEIEQMVEAHESRQMPTATFLARAGEDRLYEMTRNPQVLDILVTATQNAWPKTRAEVFQFAVERIVTEHSEAHQIATRTTRVTVPRLLDAAGFLSTVMLLANEPVFTSDTGDQTRPSLLSLDYDDFGALNAVTKSKLFKGAAGDVTYVHRSIAEYLCGVYLTQLIQTGLPLGRTLALITGDDGVPVSALRGVFAWLTTLSLSNREALMRWDPLGLILYGDINQFTTSEKRVLLEALAHSFDEAAQGFREIRGAGRAFTGFCRQEMRDIVIAQLTSTDRQEGHQLLTCCLIEGLQFDDATKVQDELLEVVRDASWIMLVRGRALDAAIAQDTSEPKLIQLAQEVVNGTIVDNDDDLLGTLLDRLYPTVITPNTVFDYLHPLKRPNLLGSYQQFWLDKLSRASHDELVPILLDELVARPAIIASQETEIHIQTLLTRLLSRGVTRWGEQIPRNRLIAWLTLGIDDFGTSRLSGRDKDIEQLRDWFSKREQLQLDLATSSLDDVRRQGVPPGELWRHFYKSHGLLQGATLTPKLHHWYLTQSLSDLDSPYTEELFRLAYRALEDDPTLQVRVDQISNEHRVAGWITQIHRERAEFEASQNEHRLARETHRAERDSEQQEFIDFIRGQLAVIRAGRAQLMVYHKLGMAYFGRYVDFPGGTPQERLDDYFEDDALVNGVIEGLHSCLVREDLPAPKKIFELNSDSRIHALALPLIAAVQERTKDNPSVVTMLPEPVLCLAVAIHLAHGHSEPNPWFTYLLTHLTELVGPVMRDYLMHQIRKGVEHVSLSYHLAQTEDYAAVATDISVDVLRTFPARAPAKQHGILEDLLKAAHRYDRARLQDLISEKLAKTNLSLGQRVRWLTMGALLDPDTHLTPLESLAANKKSQVATIRSMIAPDHREHDLTTALPSDTLVRLVRLFATSFPPVEFGSGGWVSPGMDATEHVQQLIVRLSERTDSIATSGFELYWIVKRENNRKEFIKRKHEDDIRNAFLLQLKPRLSEFQLTAEPEGQYANAKRADIKVIRPGANEINIPIEIKCSDHDEVWTAMKSQLEAQYTPDPGTDGYGIYLVFWFGPENTKGRRGIPKPASALEFQEQLIEQLPDGPARRLISVVVIDCAEPES